MDAQTFAEWQREQDDEVWAAYAPLAEDGPHNGGCGCAVSQVFGGDCAHTIDLEYELGGDPELVTTQYCANKRCSRARDHVGQCYEPAWLAPRAEEATK